LRAYGATGYAAIVALAIGRVVYDLTVSCTSWSDLLKLPAWRSPT
jgi:hypothetical protein